MAEEKDRRITELEAEVRRWGRAYLEVSQREADREGERDAALAVIEKALTFATDGRELVDSIGDVRRALASVDTSALAERDAETRRIGRGEGWHEATRAFAWAQKHGPDPLTYVSEHNPYRALAEKGADHG